MSGKKDMPADREAMEAAMLAQLTDLQSRDPAAYEAFVEQMRQSVQNHKANSKEESTVDEQGRPIISGKKKGNTGMSFEQLMSTLESPPSSSPSPSSLKDATTSKIRMPNEKPVPKGIEITPTPGFAFKTLIQHIGRTPIVAGSRPLGTIPPAPALSSSLQVQVGQKFFLNITTHDAVETPRMKKRLNEDGEEVEGLNIPMSVGPVRNVHDQAQRLCQVVDFIVHPSVMDELRSDTTGRYREFLCQLAMQSVEQKYGIVLDRQYRLPKLRYMGQEDAIPSQMIQDRCQSPNIEEVKEKNTKPASKPTQKKSAETLAAERKKAAQQSIAEATKDVVVRAYWLSHRIGRTNEDKEAIEASEALVAASPAAKAAGLDSTLVRILQAVSSADDGGWENSSLIWTPYNQPLTEYVDPVLAPPTIAPSPDHDTTPVRAFCIHADFQLSETFNTDDVVVRVSPYRVQLSIPGYRQASLSLGAMVNGGLVSWTIHSVPGFVSLRRMSIVCPLDQTSWSSTMDPGSKPWLLSHALAGDDESNIVADGVPTLPPNPYRGCAHTKKSDGTITDNTSNADLLPEDRFHIRLPTNVDQYTGQEMDEPSEGSRTLDDIEFPEDRFHRRDAGSQHLIQQREDARREKWEKANLERENRKNDPNVEYVDVEDFQPGGKYGPALAESQKQEIEKNEEFQQTLSRASKVVSEKLGESKVSNVLKSNLWTELLD